MLFQLLRKDLPGHPENLLLRFGQELAEARSSWSLALGTDLCAKLNLRRCAHRVRPCQPSSTDEPAKFLCEPTALKRKFSLFMSSFLLVRQCCNLIGWLN